MEDVKPTRQLSPEVSGKMSNEIYQRKSARLYWILPISSQEELAPSFEHHFIPGRYIATPVSVVRVR